MIQCFSQPSYTISNFNFRELLSSAERSKLAYTISDNDPLCISSTDQDCQAVFWRSRDRLYLTFRGTTSKKDIITDLDIRRLCIKDKIKVHTGFFKQFVSVEKLIRECLDRNKDATELFIAGHSLGGALSYIAAAHFGEMYPDFKVVCHTFGSPRVGNKAFVDWFNKNVHEHIRVINKHDPVPMIPQSHVWIHPSESCIQISKNGQCKEIKKDIPWYKRLFTLATQINIDDHNLDIYIDTLIELENERGLMSIMSGEV